MFNKRLRECRMAKKLTQQNIADHLQVTLNSYQKYEQGTREPSFATLVALADLFEVTTDYLLCREPAPAASADERR